MSTTFKPSYSAATQITVTTSALAAAGARQSTVVDNTSNLYEDALVSVVAKATSAPTAGGTVNIWLYSIGGDGMIPTVDTRLQFGANGQIYFSLALAFSKSLSATEMNAIMSDPKGTLFRSNNRPDRMATAAAAATNSGFFRMMGM